MRDLEAIADRVEIEALRGEFTDAAMTNDFGTGGPATDGSVDETFSTLGSGVAVPEPSSLVLIALMGLAMIYRSRAGRGQGRG